MNVRGMYRACQEHVKEIEIFLELSQGPDLDDWGNDNSKFSVLDIYYKFLCISSFCVWFCMKLFSMLCANCHFTAVLLGIYVSQTQTVLAYEEFA